MTPKSIISLIFAGLSVLLLGWAAVVILEWRAASQRLPVVEQKLKDTMTYIENSEKLRQEAAQGYADEISKLRAGASKPPRVIRVCDRLAVSPVPQPSPGADDPAPATGVLPQEPGRDIGPGLYAKADEADREIARYRALQDWAERVKKSQR